MKLINVVKNIVLDVVIVLLLGTIIFSYLNRNKPVPIFNYYLFTVLTGSMQNTLYPGDNIIVKKVDEYKVGDIVTYKLESAYVTHRIVKIDGDMVTTKGDANQSEDDAFNKENILGKFVYKSNLLNFVLKNKMLIIIFVLILYLFDIIIKDKKKVEDSET